MERSLRAGLGFMHLDSLPIMHWNHRLFELLQVIVHVIGP